MSQAEQIVATFERQRRAGLAIKALLRKTTAGEYDPETGAAAQQVVDHEATCMFFDYAQRDVDGTLIRVGDQRVLMAPDVERPVSGDAIVVDESVWTVVQVGVVGPALVPLLYRLQVRGTA